MSQNQKNVLMICTDHWSSGYQTYAVGKLHVYPCDFYVFDEWRMGKIGEISLEDMLKTESARSFLLNGENKPLECSECKWKSICNGGCQNDWIYSDGNAHNYFCQSFDTFFNYAINRLMNVARAEYTARLNR